VKAAELRELTASELAEKLDEAKAELFNLRFQLATNQLDNTARMRDVRKEVARILTVMREQELEAWRSQQAETGERG
jgi:large subunit ribosomal protein L29